ncbi:MAG: ABC-F family ATP-binding cassette domain-containing protein [bacterium]
MQKNISLKNVEYSIREKPILQGVSFKCSENERLCIFGENGAGKSTLLKILCGQIEADSGVIDKQGHIRFVYVPQEFDHAYKEVSIEGYIKELAGDKLSQKVFNYANELGFNVEKNKESLCGSLSGGQQKILALSVAFALGPDFLLMDEPENHLDIVSRIELVSLLKEFRGGIIFISHDRLLIDAIATKIGEIAGGKIHISEGGYDDYIEMKMERIGGLQRQYDAETKRIKQLSSAIVILQQKAFRGKEISAYRRAKEELDGLKKAHKESSRPDDKKTKIKLVGADQLIHSGKLVCKMDAGSFGFEQKTKVSGKKVKEDAKKIIFNNANLEIRSGEKIVLLGRNGSGKSTFLKCLTGELPLLHGEMTWRPAVKWAYFDQHAQFDPESRAVEIVMDKLNANDEDARTALGKMKFDSDRMNQQVKSLSGGERMRLRFAIVFGLKPDLIILDEPTNHIDEVTWEILLLACQTSKSTILLVSHDYEFIEAFNPTVFWLIHGQKVEARHKDLNTLLDEIK